MGMLACVFFIFFLTILALFYYSKISKKHHWFDQPDEERKIHQDAKPTSAGLVFMLPLFAIIVSIPAILIPHTTNFIFSLIVLLIVGGIDDFKPVSAKFKFFIIVIVCLTIVSDLFSQSTQFSLMVLVVYVIGMIWWLNLYNFMDGADGMATIHALLTSCAYFLLFTFFGDNLIMSLFIFMFILSLLAFLFFNFPVAKMFMGDSGSLSVAFVLAFLALFGISSHFFDEVIVISIHLVFIIDASLTIIMRLKNKHSIAQAHNLHLFQGLINQGLSHAKVTLYYAFVTLILIIITLISLYIDISYYSRLIILLVESIILAYFWFKFIDITKFKHNLSKINT